MSSSSLQEIPLHENEFSAIQHFIFTSAGISLSASKKILVAGRLGKRLRVNGLNSYSAYLTLIGEDSAERQIALDMLTTNETYFFREPQHFDYLRTHILPLRTRSEPFRVWSAASSSGEESYSIAMLLESELGGGHWEILGTDISTQMLEKCRLGRYPLARAQHIPREYLQRYCLKGVGQEEGFLLVQRQLRSNLRFLHANLNAPLPDIGEFELIFLRNVMIYFDNQTKQGLVERIQDHLRPGGFVFIGHSESLHGIRHNLRQIRPAIYQKR